MLNNSISIKNTFIIRTLEMHGTSNCTKPILECSGIFNRIGSTWVQLTSKIYGLPMFISQAGEVMPLLATNNISVFKLFSCANTLKIE